MKQVKSSKIYPGEEILDPKLKKDLDHLIKIGYIERFVMNGETIYGITPLGDKYAKEVLKLDENKPRHIKDLP